MKFFIRSFLFVRIHRANAIVGYHKWNWIATSEMVLWELSHLTCDNVIPIMAVYFHSTVVLEASGEFLKQLSKKTHPRNESVWIKDLFKCHRWSITTRESHPQSQQWKIGNMRKIGIWFFRYLLHRMNFYYSFTLVHYFHQSFFLMYCFCQCWSHYSFFLIRYR